LPGKTKPEERYSYKNGDLRILKMEGGEIKENDGRGEFN
jgi:hypothetical protein